jgi:hypothetical protein
MNVKEILDFEERVNTESLEESEIESYLDELGDYLNAKSEEGQKIITNRMKEEDFVRLVREIKKALMVSMLHQDTGALLAIADMAGELDPFIHASFLSILAILAEEEVI